jgi:hypothetical protein
MARRIRRRLTFSNVCSFIALVVALGTGGAYAANTIGSDDIIDESIQNVDLGTNSVQATEVADNSIDTGEVIDDSLFAVDLAPDSVTSSELAANAVKTAEVAADSLTLADIAGAAANGAISLSGIPNGRCTQVTFSIAGLQVGDSPIVTTRAAIQNGILLYPNRVATVGHLEVNACNFSGGAMTPISNFPVRIVSLR